MAKNDNFLGFGVEYESSEDYGYSDMSKEQVDELYHINPKIFATYSGAKFLRSLGYEVETPRLVFNLHIDVDELDRFISFHRDVSSSYVEQMLSGDIEYNNYDSTSWQYSTYDAENTNTIREFIKKTVHVLEDSEVTVDNIDDMNFEDLLEFANREEYYDDLMGIINDSNNQCTSDANYYNVIASVKSTLEEYGTVRSLNGEGADMEIVLNSYLDNLNPSEVDELLANYDLPDAFAQLVADGEIEKPRLYIRDNSYCNDDNFNEILKERLGELN